MNSPRTHRRAPRTRVNNPAKRPTFAEVQQALEDVARDARASVFTLEEENNKSYQSILHKARTAPAVDLDWKHQTKKPRCAPSLGA